MQFLPSFYSLAPVAGFPAHVPVFVVLKHTPQPAPHGGIVVDNKNSLHDLDLSRICHAKCLGCNRDFAALHFVSGIQAKPAPRCCNPSGPVVSNWKVSLHTWAQRYPRM